MKDSHQENQTNQETQSTNHHPYMGGVTSEAVGHMAYAGKLGGEMVKRMIASVEEDMANGSVKPEDLI